MKLANVNYNNRVQSLGRQNVYAPIQTAGAINSALNSTRGVIEQVRTDMLEAQSDEASASLVEWNADFQSENDGIEYYDGTDSRLDGLSVTRTETVNGIEVPRKVPAYEVRTELYESGVKKRIDELSQNIQSDKVAKGWAQGQMNTANDATAQRRVDDVKSLKAYTKDKNIEVGKRLVDGNHYAAAIEHGRNTIKDPVERAQFVEGVQRQQEVDIVNTAIGNDDMAGMVALRTELQPKNYRGVLQEDELVALRKQLSSSINSLKTKNDGEDMAAWAANRTDEVMAMGMGYREGLDAIQTGSGTQKAKDNAKKRYRQRWTDAQNGLDMDEFMARRETAFQIAAGDYAITPDTQDDVAASVNKYLAQGSIPEHNPRRYYALLNEARVDPQKFKNRDLNAYIHEVDKASFKQLQTAQQDLHEGKDLKHTKIMTDAGQGSAFARSMGVDDMSSDKADVLKQKFQDAVIIQEQSLGREMTSAELQQLQRDLGKELVTDINWWPIDRTEDIGDVPAEEIPGLSKQLRDNGLKITGPNLIWLYNQ